MILEQYRACKMFYNVSQKYPHLLENSRPFPLVLSYHWGHLKSAILWVANDLELPLEQIYTETITTSSFLRLQLQM